MPEGWLTTLEAAEYLGVSRSRVLAMIRSDLLEAEKFGPVWMIRRSVIEVFRETRRTQPGRPREKRSYRKDGD
jgi:excisionase family DNA binding protein